MDIDPCPRNRGRARQASVRWCVFACSRAERADTVAASSETAAIGTSHRASELGAPTSGSVSTCTTIVRSEARAAWSASSRSATVVTEITSAPRLRAHARATGRLGGSTPAAVTAMGGRPVVGRRGRLGHRAERDEPGGWVGLGCGVASDPPQLRRREAAIDQRAGAFGRNCGTTNPRMRTGAERDHEGAAAVVLGDDGTAGLPRPCLELERARARVEQDVKLVTDRQCGERCGDEDFEPRAELERPRLASPSNQAGYPWSRMSGTRRDPPGATA